MSAQLVLSLSVVLILALGVPVLFLLSSKLGPQESTKNSKNIPYESGITHCVGGCDNRFSVKFYLVAILFVLFDVEIVFMFPWAVRVRELGYFGLFEMFAFIALLILGLIYVYRSGALKWQ
ncbi:MAG: NADH-quinone oxidoreductase subunit A [Sulfurospirillaceae bacterium]|nr:NADH-quinone oxidoreductase subunit A [Sulfurospirillaceae bacterium]